MSNAATIEAPTSQKFTAYGDVISPTSSKLHSRRFVGHSLGTERIHPQPKKKTSQPTINFTQEQNGCNENSTVSGSEQPVMFGLHSPNKIPLIEEPVTPLALPPTKSNIDPRNFDDVQYVANTVRQLAHLTETPRIGIICGSGLGGMADLLTDTRIVPYSSVPGFPQTSVVGHRGNLVFGWLDDFYVMCFQGRFHPYEHHMDLALCGMPVRIMHMLGVEILFVSNAAGGMNSKYRCGDLMIIKDQISMPALVGFGPLVGINDPRFGPRFVSVHDAYDKQMRQIALSVAAELNISVHEGVYVMNGGPQYETPAEITFLKMVGGDAVGMSTCHEVIVARQCGMRVFGFSLITNMCNTNVDSAVEVSHEEVIQTGREAGEQACNLVAAVVKRMNNTNLPQPRVPHVDSYIVHDDITKS